jgi:site-specific DNA recombinase
MSTSTKVTTGTKRAVGYFRVSTTGQAGEHHSSLETQEAHFREFCQFHDYIVAETFTDIVSGRRDDRNEYLRMVRFALDGGADIVVVQFLDRFGRNPYEIVNRVSELRKFGVPVVATDENIEDELIFFIKAAMAGAESRRTSERVRATMAIAVGKGVHAARAPYGLRRVRTVEGSEIKVTWELDPSEADTVREMVRMRVDQNFGFKRIADALTASGIRAREGRPFTGNTVGIILSNAAIMGDNVYGKKARKGNPDAEVLTVPGFFPAILTGDEWDRLQERRVIRSESPHGRTHSSIYLLSGIVRCGHCGGPMVGKVGALRKAKKAAPGERYRNYYCSWAIRGAGLCSVSNGHAAHRLEQAVIEYLGQYSDPGLVREKLAATEADVSGRKSVELEAARKRLQELEDAVARDLDRLDRGILTEDDYVKVSGIRREETDRLRPRESELALEVQREQDSAELAERLPVEIRSFVEDFENLDVTRRKAWLQTILKAANVWNDGRVELDFRA